jgi:hypothetical protein
VVADGGRAGSDPRRAATQRTASAAQRLPHRLSELQGERLYRFAGLLFLLAILFRYFDAISRVLLIAFVGAILAVASTRSSAGCRSVAASACCCSCC